MRRAKEENPPWFSSKKLDTGVTKAKNAGFKNSKEMPLDQMNKNFEYGEDVKSSFLKPKTNIFKERETELNSNGSGFQSSSSLQQQLQLEVKESDPLNLNESDCEIAGSVTASERVNQICTQDLSKNTFDKWESVGENKLKLAERVSHRRKLTNIRLSQLIFPKCAWMVLNDLKKGCVFETKEKCKSPRLILVTVKHKDGLMAVGEGSSKAEAKNIAAENAIKKIVLDLIFQKESSYSKDVDFKDTEGSQKIIMNLPWKELTSLAVYKLFEEWQSQGVQFPKLFLSKLKAPPPVSNEDVPSDTNERNPCAVLTTIIPGIAAVEVERQDFPRFSVTMGYLVEGKLYSASGETKKEAKKKAAMVVLKTLYGMEIPE